MLAPYWKHSLVDAIKSSALFDGGLNIFDKAVESWEGFKEFVFEVCAFKRVGDYVVVARVATLFEAADERLRALVFQIFRPFIVADSADGSDFVRACAVSLVLRLYRFRTASHSCLWGQTISSPVLGAACFEDACPLLSFEIVVAPSRVLCL